MSPILYRPAVLLHMLERRENESYPLQARSAPAHAAHPIQIEGVGRENELPTEIEGVGQALTSLRLPSD